MNLATAANRLHHLSMRYAGALVELLKGEKIAFLPDKHPGLREARDLIDLILLTRAEINALTQALHETGLLVTDGQAADVAGVAAKPITLQRWNDIVTENYKWFTEQKARFLNVGVSDDGIVIYGPQKGN